MSRHRVPEEVHVGFLVFDAGGQSLGRLTVVYHDRETSRPAFGAVTMIRRGRRRAVFVPLDGSRVDEQEQAVTLRCGRELVRRAPATQAGRDLSADVEPDLYAHYDLAYESPGAGVRRLVDRVRA